MREQFMKFIEDNNPKILSMSNYKHFLTYFRKNYLDKKGKFSDFIKYNLDEFDNIENDLYIRSNNVIERYHNRSKFFTYYFST